MVSDINSSTGVFESLSAPEEGCIVVYGAGKAIGHVGIVSKVVNGQMQKVIHCSSGNDKTYKDSIRVTPPKVFNRADFGDDTLVEIIYLFNSLNNKAG